MLKIKKVFANECRALVEFGNGTNVSLFANILYNACISLHNCSVKTSDI
jgi:hypothetical protein